MRAFLLSCGVIGGVLGLVYLLAIFSPDMMYRRNLGDIHKTEVASVIAWPSTKGAKFIIGTTSDDFKGVVEIKIFKPEGGVWESRHEIMSGDRRLTLRDKKLNAYQVASLKGDAFKAGEHYRIECVISGAPENVEASLWLCYVAPWKMFSGDR